MSRIEQRPTVWAAAIAGSLGLHAGALLLIDGLDPADSRAPADAAAIELIPLALPAMRSAPVLPRPVAPGGVTAEPSPATPIASLTPAAPRAARAGALARASPAAPGAAESVAARLLEPARPPAEPPGASGSRPAEAPRAAPGDAVEARPAEAVASGGPSIVAMLAMPAEAPRVPPADATAVRPAGAVASGVPSLTAMLAVPAEAARATLGDAVEARPAAVVASGSPSLTAMLVAPAEAARATPVDADKVRPAEAVASGVPSITAMLAAPAEAARDTPGGLAGVQPPAPLAASGVPAGVATSPATAVPVPSVQRAERQAVSAVAAAAPLSGIAGSAARVLEGLPPPQAAASAPPSAQEAASEALLVIAALPAGLDRASRERLAARLAIEPCGRVGFEDSIDGIRLDGFVPSATAARSLLAEVAAIVAPRAVESGLSVQPWPFCAFLRLAAGGGGPGTAGLLLNRPDGVYHEGDLLVVDVTTALERPGYLYVDFIDHEGTVFHLLPQALEAGNRVAPGGLERVRLGTEDEAGEPHRRAYPVVPPFGPAMLLSHLTEQPLFPALRDEAEPSSVYLPALEQALATRAGGYTREIRMLDTRP